MMKAIVRLRWLRHGHGGKNWMTSSSSSITTAISATTTTTTYSSSNATTTISSTSATASGYLIEGVLLYQMR